MADVERTVAARRKHQDEVIDRVTHPVRPVNDEVDIKAMHLKVSKRFPKVLAELAR